MLDEISDRRYFTDRSTRSADLKTAQDKDGNIPSRSKCSSLMSSVVEAFNVSLTWGKTWGRGLLPWEPRLVGRKEASITDVTHVWDIRSERFPGHHSGFNQTGSRGRVESGAGRACTCYRRVGQRHTCVLKR